MRICSVSGCTKKHFGLGVCAAHYYRKKQGISLEPAIGKIPLWGRWMKNHAATEHPSVLNIAWAAGIFEGEGSVSVSQRGASETVSIVQKETWLLLQLKALFGGSIYTRPGKRFAGYVPMSSWVVCGPRARGFLYSIFTFLSPHRRKQVRRAFNAET